MAKKKKIIEAWRKTPPTYTMGEKEYPFRTAFHLDTTKKHYSHIVMSHDLHKGNKVIS